MLQARPRRTRRRLLVACAVVVATGLLAGVGAIGYRHLRGPSSTAESRIAAHPQPPLFATADVSTLEATIVAQAPRARALMAGWWDEHGRTRDDDAFTAYLVNNLPAPAPQARRTAEARALAPLVGSHTAADSKAAAWLKEFGTHDVWRVYLHRQNAALPARADRRTTDLTAMLPFAAKASTQVARSARQSAPYVLDPALRHGMVVGPGQVCPCSYPSWESTVAAAAATYLGHDQPDRRASYLRMQGRIGYARTYAGGELPSDVAAGALLGDMVGEYYLHAR